MTNIEQILKDSKYKLEQFSTDEISAIEEKIYTKSNGKFFIKCLIRDREIQLKPEEVIRQLFIYKLLTKYGYEESRIKVEHEIYFGREKKRADIVITNKEHPDTVYIIVEVKRPKVEDGEAQLKSYCHASGAPIAVWTNGEKTVCWTRQDPNIFIPLSDIPYSKQTLEEMQQQLWYFEDLKENDILSQGTITLSKLIKELEDDILANAGVDSFEEVFKLIFTKLYDEKLSANDKGHFLEFRNYNVYTKGNTKEEKEANNIKNKQLAGTIQTLFNKAKKKWGGVFAEEDLIELTPSHLAICILKLQNVKLFNSNLEVIDEAFEYLINKSQKGEKGQYFTPRYVIDMCVKMLNPKENEFMIDTAAGSCGFPVHTMFHVWQSICDRLGKSRSDLFTAENKPQECIDYVENYVFAIDFDEKAVRVARTLNLIAGDGKTNVIRLNTLDYKRWGEVVNNIKWQKKYSQGWLKLHDLRAGEDEDDYQNFKFDVLMANPPFAGDVKEPEIIQNYKIAEKLVKKKKNSDGEEEIKQKDKISRDVLFIERNLQFLKPGGRMAIVLPQGRFNNSSDKYIRDFIAERCRILAVVGLHGNVFKPHTGTKTSVLFVQKWDDKLCPRRDDYPIFFATMKKPSKDNSGEKIYVADAENIPLRDSHNHLIVEHDLFNHDGLTQDGIFEAFREFAKRENLSFFDSSSFDEVHYKNLLEELECTEILLSELYTDNEKNRLDAEFFQKKYIQSYNKIKSISHSTIGDEIKVLTDFHANGSYENIARVFELLDNPNYAYMVRTIDLERDNYIDDVKYVTKQAYEFLSKSKVYGGEVIINKIGNPGRTFLMPYLNKPVSLGMNLFMLNTKSDGKICNELMYVFLNSDIGKNIIERKINGTVPLTIDKNAVRSIYVPIFSDDFQQMIKHLVNSNLKLREESTEVYKTAEKILAQALHLEDFKPSEENTSEINFSQVFSIGRLDAEYYQPKYNDYRNAMDTAGTVENLCNVYDENFLPKSDEIYKYIELANVGTNGNISTPDKIIGASLPTRARRIVKAGQVIISSIEGSLQSCALITDENNEALCSTGFFVVDSENYNSATLLILFKFELMQNLMKQNCSGTILTAISKENFLNLPLPKIEIKIQEKISELVEKSFELRAESTRLLEMAKIAVELAIERGEDVATEYLRGGNIGT